MVPKVLHVQDHDGATLVELEFSTCPISSDTEDAKIVTENEANDYQGEDQCDDQTDGGLLYYVVYHK